MKVFFQKRGIFPKKAVLYLTIFIIVVGALVGFASLNAANSPAQLAPDVAGGLSVPLFGANVGAANNIGQNNGSVIINAGPAVMSSMTTVAGATTITQSASVMSSSTAGSQYGNGQPNPSGTPSTGGNQSAAGGQGNNNGFLEFFSNISLVVPAPSTTMKKVSALAYSLGGYVAYSFAQNTSAVAVLRIPANNYQTALTEVEALGNVTLAASTSNDVSVKYTDLNATLQSLLTEQSSLIRLLNESASVNETLLIESQIQGVDAQINAIESSLLETRTLIDYSTITVNMELAPKPVPPPKPLTLKVTATPTSGQSPLAVTFNALVNGGVAPYIVNYNFGDGTSTQAQALIHTFQGADTYNVTVSVTDSSGNVTMQSLTINVSNPPTHVGISTFLGTIASLFIYVIEGIVEVAVVVLPLAAIAAVIIFPFRARARANANKKVPTGSDSSASSP